MSEGFQFKLYRLVSQGASGITWSNTGDSIFIDVAKFKKFLSRDNTFCKSKNVNSFVRQLNLYGFKIVIDLERENNKHSHNKNLKEYSNSYFLRGRSDLLPNVTRNGREVKLKLPRAAQFPLPAQNWGKRKRQVTKQDQFNPAAKMIKQEVIDESYQTFEYGNPKIKQVDPLSKKIKQEIIDSSYECYQSNTSPRKELVAEKENPLYKELSTTMPYGDSTRYKKEALASILKPPSESNSKVTEDKNIVRNGRSRRSKKNIKKTELQFYSENAENSSVVNNCDEPQNAASAPPIQVLTTTVPPEVNDECTNKSVPSNVVDLTDPSKTVTVESKIVPNISPETDVISKLTEEKFHLFEMESLKQIKATKVRNNAVFSDVSCAEDLHELKMENLKQNKATKVLNNAALSHVSRREDLYEFEMESLKQIKATNKQNNAALSDVSRREDLYQVELESFKQLQVTNVLTNATTSDISRGEGLHEIEEVVILDQQDVSKNTVGVSENRDHQYARSSDEETNQNMVNQTAYDDETDFDLLPWRKRPPSTVVLPKVLPRYESDYDYPCPLQTENMEHALNMWEEEDTTDPIINPGSEGVMWSSSLLRDQKSYRRALVQEYCRKTYKPFIVYNGYGEPKPRTLQEVLDYKVKK